MSTPESYTADDVQAALRQALGAEGAVLLPLFGGAAGWQTTMGTLRGMDQSYGAVTEANGLLNPADHSQRHLPRAFYHTCIENWLQGNRPSLPSLALAQLHHMGIDPRDGGLPPDIQALARALMLTAARAEMVKGQPRTPESWKQANAYHNAAHTAHVATMSYYQYALNRHRGFAPALGTKEALTLLVAAYAHDIDHPGTGNPADQPHFNEDNTFSIVRPILQETGVGQDTINTMEAMLRTTSPNGPHRALKQAAARFHGRVLHDAEPIPEFIALQDLFADETRTELAAMLSDADLFASAGAGLQSNKFMSDLIMKEFGRQAAAPSDNDRKFFLDKIVGVDGFASRPGRDGFGKILAGLRGITEISIQLKGQNKLGGPGQ